MQLTAFKQMQVFISEFPIRLADLRVGLMFTNEDRTILVLKQKDGDPVVVGTGESYSPPLPEGMDLGDIMIYAAMIQ